MAYLFEPRHNITTSPVLSQLIEEQFQVVNIKVQLDTGSLLKFYSSSQDLTKFK